MTRLVLGGGFLACVLVACGGSTDEGLNGGGGASSGGASSGGASSGGASAGGTSAGGTSAGGTAGAGGTAAGGTSAGGTSAGGTAGAGGTSAGGTSAGGAAGVGGTAAGGTGGTTGVSCSDLATKYLGALAAAKSCNPMLSVIQCDKKVLDKIVCGCPTFVNHNNSAALAELAKLTEQWKQLGCDKNVACPEIACLEPTNGFCSPGPGGGKCMNAGGV